MRLTSTLTLTLLLACACNSGGGSETGNDTGTASTTNPGSTGTATTGGEPTGTSTGTGTTTGTSTGEPVTTGEPATGSTGVPGTTGSSTTGDPGTSTTDPGSSSGDTGVTPAGACETDKDCHLHDDCCDCYGLPVGQDDPLCESNCEQPMCGALGIDAAVCRFGVCISEPLGCDASDVLCKALPPECPEGSLPGVSGDCWSGICVPIRNCDAVPDCALCPADTMCVHKVSKKQSWPSCEPIPAACDSEIDCKCAGTFVCTGSFNICNDLEGNELSCGCPAC